MALELKQSLSLTQQLIMTPQLQQAIKLLQLSRLELLETIDMELEENPVLEEQLVTETEEDSSLREERTEIEQDGPDIAEVTVEERARDDVDWENYVSEYSSSDWSPSPRETRESPPIDNITSTKTSLNSHLMWQLSVSNFDDERKDIGAHIIGNLDEDGYLDISLEEISQVTGFSLEKVNETLGLIQKFDPVGVAARDLRECLLIQVRFHNFDGSIVEKIILDHLGNLEDKKYDQITKKLSVPIQEVLAAVAVIQGFEPKPGRIHSEEETVYITPDIYVVKVGDDYEIVQNEDGLRKLKINSYYKELLRNKNSESDVAKDYIKEKIRSAAWLIKSIHQRQRTIYRVTESIVRFQRDFLDKGISQLKPLVLRDVAEDIEMHESTISRVTTNKYVQTPQGLFELKYFFNSPINKVYGDAVASKSVIDHIRRIIKAEDKKSPCSDQEVANILEKMNIKVARRTVSKYRESIGILPSRKRKVY